MIDSHIPKESILERLIPKDEGRSPKGKGQTLGKAQPKHYRTPNQLSLSQHFLKGQARLKHLCYETQIKNRKKRKAYLQSKKTN